MILCINGSRGITDYSLVKDAYFNTLPSTIGESITTIISGGARGVDTLAIELAKELLLPFKVYPAEWNIYGKSAGYRRNVVMADHCNYLLSVWDGKSRGTLHMIEICKTRYIPTFIHYV